MLLNSQPTLHTSRLLLRPLTVTDAPEVRRLAGAREIADTTLNVPHPYQDGMAEAWIEKQAAAFGTQDFATFAVTDLEGALLGTVGLRLEPRHRRAELGYWIGVPYWGRGYATEAASAIIGYGFATLNLNRIQATHVIWNPASGRVLRKVGMTYEGLLRQYVLKNGRFEDLARYAILRGDR